MYLKWIIGYVIVAVLYEVSSGLLAWRKFKKKSKTPQYETIIMVKNQLLESPSMRNLKKKVFNWYTIPFIIVPFAIQMMCLMFPLSVFRKLRRLIFGKTKLEKEAEAEEKVMEDARKAQEEWMKTEGEIAFIDEPIKARDYNIIDEEE